MTVRDTLLKWKTDMEICPFHAHSCGLGHEKQGGKIFLSHSQYKLIEEKKKMTQLSLKSRTSNTVKRQTEACWGRSANYLAVECLLLV